MCAPCWPAAAEPRPREPRGTVLDYHRNFLAAAEASELFDSLCHAAHWRQEHLRLFGRSVPVPRLLAWYGDCGLNYRYSGIDHVCRGWLPELAALRQRLRNEFGMCCNLVLLNRYRSGADYMGWHADDERGHGPRVASVSLGAPRRFLVRRMAQPGAESLQLEHGSLLVFPGSRRHSLPRSRRPVGERINLTFRWLEPKTS